MVILLYVCGKQKAPRRGGWRERGKGAYGVKTNRDEERECVVMGRRKFWKILRKFWKFYLGDRQQGFPFFFLFWVVSSLHRDWRSRKERDPSFAKFTSGVLPPRKKIGKVTSPYWKLIRTHFFTCLSTFSLSRSRPPIQSILSPRSTLLLEVGGL